MPYYYVIKMQRAKRGPRALPPISKGQRVEREQQQEVDRPPLKQPGSSKAPLGQEQAKKIVA